MKNSVISIATALLLSACAAGAITPPTATSASRFASVLSSSVNTLHFVIPINAPAAFFDPCTNPASVINGTESGKLEMNEQFGSAGNIQIFHYVQTSVFTSSDGLYNGRYTAGSPGLVNDVNGFTVGSGHIIFNISGPTGTLQVQETSHFRFAANGTPSITNQQFKVICRAN